MPTAAILIALLAVAGVLAMFVLVGRSARSGSGTRSKQRAKRETAQARADASSSPPGDADTSVSDDAPRMPMGDLPPTP